MMKQNLSAKTSFFNALRLLFRNRVGELLLFPLTNGKKADSFFAKFPANYYQYRKPSIREVERNGFAFTLDLSDYMQWVIFFGVEAEPRNTLYDLVKPEMTVFDIGANIGETTLSFSRIAKRIYSFEPDKETFAKLKKHVALNNCLNVHLCNYGLGAVETVAAMERNANNSGGNRVVEAKGDAHEIEIKVLDELIASGQLPVPDFIKIDVEGFEAEVLKGSSQTLKQHHPIIFAEMNNNLLGRNETFVKNVLDFLRDHGYTVVRADTGKNITSAGSFGNDHFDIIARPV
jgi:FkbM family methyltransferase